MADQDYIGIEGLEYPENGKRLFQEDFQSEQSAIGNEMIDRESDYFTFGIIEGFEVTVSTTSGCVDVSAGKARDPEGRRILLGSTSDFSIPDGQTVKVVVRHIWEDDEYVPEGGTETKIIRRHSAEIDYIENTASPSDRELELARVTRSGSSVTINEDLRVWTILLEEVLFHSGAVNRRVIVTTATQQMENNKEYLVNYSGGRCTLILPVTSNVSDTIKVRDIGVYGWQIAQNAGQNILLQNGKSTVPGTTGDIHSRTGGAAVELICTAANTTWKIVYLLDEWMMKGYCLGGYTTDVTAVIEDMNFATETSDVISATIDSSRRAGAGVSGNAKGYFMGGLTSVNVSLIDNMNFANETSVQISATLNTNKRGLAGVSGNLKGYAMGGIDDTSNPVAVIEDMNFATEISDVISATLNTAKYSGCGVQGKSKGYIMGGIATGYVAVIEDMNFATETSDVISATLDTAKSDSVGVSGSLKGYAMGGKTGSPIAVIEDMNFATETSDVISATLDTARSASAGVSGNLKGYFMGGFTDSPTATIEDMNFASESSNTISATLNTAKYQGVGVQGYIG